MIESSTGEAPETTNAIAASSEVASHIAEPAAENPATFERIKAKLEEMKVPFKLT